MRVIVVGFGVQGRKRQGVAGSEAVATVDPVAPDAGYRNVKDVPLGEYDAALVCTPEDAKLEILRYLITNGKHVLVEKPLLAEEDSAVERIAELSLSRGVVCYTAYNHRFEPHFVRMRDVLRTGRIGRPYMVRMFYGNGTARLVRDSEWRDRGSGVLRDLGSHLLDTLEFWFGELEGEFRIRSAHRFENRAFDHVIVSSEGPPFAELEMTLLSWRNHFTADVFAEGGSAHIRSLCKWGPSTFTLRTRMLPSGRPPEEHETLTQADPTWEIEYAHFKTLCSERRPGNTRNDIRLNRTLRRLGREALEIAP